MAVPAVIYIRRGFSLVPLEGKRPTQTGWYLPGRLVVTEDAAREVFGAVPPPNIGYHLAASGVVELDLDAVELARKALGAAGVSVAALIASGWAIHGRGTRIVFAAPEGMTLPTYRFTIPDPTPDKPHRRRTVFELRSGYDAKGEVMNLQSVAPPSVHPDTGNPYRAGPIRIAPLPAGLLRLWQGYEAMLPKLRDALGVPPDDPGDDTAGENTLPYRSRYRNHFNAAVTAEGILEDNGYEQHGDRWSGPGSRGNAGIKHIRGTTDLYFCHDTDDPLRGLFDPWSAYVRLEHSGDLAAAEAAAADYVGGGDPEKARAFTTSLSPFRALTDAERATAEARQGDRDKIARLTTSLQRGDGAFYLGAFESTELAMDRLPARYIVPGILPAGMVGALVALPNTGKTALAIGLSAAVCLARPVAGLEPIEEECGMVGYFAGEDATGVHHRFRAQLEALGIEGRDGLRQAGFFVMDSLSARLGDPKATAQIIDVLRLTELRRRRPFRLFVFDTLARHRAPGLDENSAADAGDMMNSARDVALAFPGATVLVLAHPGRKETDRLRGSMAFDGDLDFILILEPTKTDAKNTLPVRPKDAPQPTGKVSTLKGTKFRADAVDGHLLTVRLARVDGREWLNVRYPSGRVQEGSALIVDNVEAARAKEDLPDVKEAGKADRRRADPEDDRAILRAVDAAGKDASQRDLAEAVGVALTTYQRAIARLVKTGLLRVATKGESKGKTFITRAGRAALEKAEGVVEK
nr:AAA family ATPase [Neoroseomonas terrae]